MGFVTLQGWYGWQKPTQIKEFYVGGFAELYFFTRRQLTIKLESNTL
jgi:hypothetical protein